MRLQIVFEKSFIECAIAQLVSQNTWPRRGSMRQRPCVTAIATRYMIICISAGRLANRRNVARDIEDFKLVLNGDVKQAEG